MPIIKSARKRVRVTRSATVRNAKTKRELKTALKKLSKNATLKDLRSAQSAIDKATKKHVIHKNKAARLKSRASRLAKVSGVKTSAKASAVKPAPKTRAKKPVKSATKPKTAK